MMNFKVALRNIMRNRRRSVMTGLTIIIGTTAVLLIGGMMSYMTLDFQTATVRRGGHLTLFKKGFFEFGAGDPSAYGIENYQNLVQKIKDDDVLKERVAVVTPYQVIYGIAGNYSANVSKTFFGQGVVPDDRRNMRHWNDYGIDEFKGDGWPLPDNPELGLVGAGLSRILGICEPLHVSNCPHLAVQNKSSGNVGGLPDQDFTALEDKDQTKAASKAVSDPTAASNPMPRLDILAATADGAPNVVSMYVHHEEFQGIKDIDDNFIVMNLKLAQQLIYGVGEHKATGVIIQLKHTRDLPLARARLEALIGKLNMKLEVKDFTELTPLYKQTVGFFGFLFIFFMSIIGLTVGFTVMNTMGMSVMERTSEIGTMRAQGATRSDIKRLFLLEGCLLGIISVALGIVCTTLVTIIVNSTNIMWTPPTAADAVPLRLFLFNNPGMMVGVGILLVVLSALAAFWPARRAARVQVIEALRHV
jgi:putative ABC transport system permease protein